MAEIIRTANQVLSDRSLRHQVQVRRFTAGEVKKMLRLLEQSDKEIAEKLRSSLGGVVNGRRVNRKRLRALLKDVREKRAALMAAFKEGVEDTVDGLIPVEVEFEQKVLQDSIPIDIDFATVNLDTVHAAVTTKPFSGGTNSAKTLEQWFESIDAADQRRLVEAIQLGVTQGESIDEIVRRVIGTRRGGFKDGILSITRRNAEAIVRTAVNHISNAAREEVWEANSDIIEALKWVSTLDGKTSAICRARDGRFAVVSLKELPRGFPALIPKGARPPAHVSCRSIMVAVLDILGIADKINTRAFVRDTRSDRQRRKDFRADARARDPKRWKESNRQERQALIKKEKERWAKENIGQVPAGTTYNDWLLQQPHDFQDQVLGKTKGKLFRTGRVTLDNFVDRRGNELTLDQLKQSHADVFREAGL